MSEQLVRLFQVSAFGVSAFIKDFRQSSLFKAIRPCYGCSILTMAVLFLSSSTVRVDGCSTLSTGSYLSTLLGSSISARDCVVGISEQLKHTMTTTTPNKYNPYFIRGKLLEWSSSTRRNNYSYSQWSLCYGNSTSLLIPSLYMLKQLNVFLELRLV